MTTFLLCFYHSQQSKHRRTKSLLFFVLVQQNRRQPYVSHLGKSCTKIHISLHGICVYCIPLRGYNPVDINILDSLYLINQRTAVEDFCASVVLQLLVTCREHRCCLFKYRLLVNSNEWCDLMLGRN